MDGIWWINQEASFVDVTNDISSFSGKFGRHNFLKKSSEMAGYSWDLEAIPECRLTKKKNLDLTAYFKKGWFGGNIFLT